jgi:dTDP-4-amino-4,6-dideoxygalactose transaminase
MFKVPKYNYAAQFPELDEQTLPEIRRLLLSGEYILGPQVARFEDDLARYLGVAHAVGVNSGTDALVLALDALGVGPGGEVITVANSFHASALAIVRRGATPVLVDCREHDYLINLSQAEAAMGHRTSALMIVHLFGQAVDVEFAAALCERMGVALIEDCAQAIGACCRGSRVGTVSDAGCWSFAPAKNLAAAGDGGAVTTSSQDTAARLRLLRHFGQPAQNQHDLVGYNSRLDSLQAFILSQKTKHLDAWNAARVRVAESYRARLAGLPLSFQEGAAPGEHVYHLFQVRTESLGVRENLVGYLRDAGIDAVVRYPVPLHLHGAFSFLGYRKGAFPAAEALAQQTLCLPIRPDLSEGDIEYVCDAVTKFFGGT